MIGKTISYYRITEKLGEGGMGIVYKAEDTRLNRSAALKFLSPHALGTDEEKARFVREAQAAAALTHPNICTIYGISEAEGQTFIEMAYVEGRSLKEAIARGPLDSDEAIRIAFQITEGLREAHEKGVIHRDIKPANIMITRDGRPIIMDFGLAKLVESTTVTRTGAVGGTAAYMSPEQARGETIDHRTDLWSLGVVLYEMVTGQRPFKSDYEQAAVYAILNEDPPSPSELRPDAPEELVHTIRKLLEKDPGNRYQTADGVLGDLRKLASGFPISDTPTAARPSASRISPVLISLAAVAVLVAAFLLLRPFLFREVLVSEPKPIAIVAFANQTGNEAFDYLEEAIPNLLITSLEQSGYLRVTTRERLRDLKKQAGRDTREPIDKDLAFELCRMDGIEALVVGSFTKAGDVFATDVKVLDVESKQILESASSRGRGPASILEKQIDELSRKISRGIGLSQRSMTASQPIRDVTTSSLEAYDLYLQGREAADRYYQREAADYLKKAVEIDPEFAAAYLHLAWVYDPIGDAKARNEAISKAWSLSDKASPKERLYIEAGHAQYIDQDLGRVAEIMAGIVRRYPQEKLAHLLLARLHRNFHRHDEAIAQFNIVLDLDPSYTPAMNSLAYTYADIGQYERAFELFGRYAAAAPGDANPYDSIADIYFRIGKLDQTIANFEKALEIRPDFASSIGKLWHVHAILGEYDRAVEWIRHWIETAPLDESKASGQRWWGYFDYWLGREKVALRRIESSRELSGDNTAGTTLSLMTLAWIHYDLGETLAGRQFVERSAELMGDYAAPRFIVVDEATRVFYHGLSDVKEGGLAAARTRLAELGTLVPEGSSAYKPTIEFYHRLLLAEILFAEGKPADAIEVFKQAQPYAVDHLHDGLLLAVYTPRKDVVARAYLDMGQVAEAIAEYERLTSTDPNVRGRMLLRPRNLYRLGKLYEKTGQVEKAKVAYERFRDLWEDADEAPGG
ncbi:MAG: protein kinase [Candidatus Eisenbacteria sp.]|nr:protein kinase [Candidatus Eisenbacteria bacterium]